ncbi:LacI family DNA-binding transcriptional regulator [Spirillospora sp. CA-294931]|uniref:LacI family DNA-binding transcriptional regulator n=1 Tax=Spirillospora sp. CA-294931 TaxID=3240042 RepID=UPI003D940BD8
MTTVTIRDVARLAGVSPATVSRVLNTSESVSTELKERVLSAVAATGYRPNSQARGLRTRATTVLGVIISDITNPFFTSMVRGAEDAASQMGYSVVLANADEDLDKERRYLEVAAAEQMAGVLLSPASATKTRIDLLTTRGIPVVTIDRQLKGAQVDRVVVNNHRAAKEATLHLVEQGCRRIGFVAGRSDTTTGARRLAGYRAGLREAGLPFDPDLVADGGFRIDGGRAATERLLARAPDALFVANNLMTIGAVSALDAKGIAFPGDLALVGFDDVMPALGLRSEITAVSQPTYEIGRGAADLLLRRVRGEDFPPRDLTLEATLHIRASSLRVQPGPMSAAPPPTG